jgi:antibiotic biosynthesis monooxygenase (ABM) superfamily enzyme
MEGTGIDHAHIKLFPMHGTKDLKGDWKQHVSKINTYFKKYPGYISSHDSHEENDEKLKNLARNLIDSYKK